MYIFSPWVFALAAQLPVAVAPAAPAPACVACRVDVDAIRGNYSAKEWAELTHGEVVTANQEAELQGSLQSDVESSAIVPRPAAEVWDVLTDYESRPRYISDAKEVRITHTEDNRVWIFEHLKFLLVNVRYQVVNTLDPEHGLMTWALDKSVPHDIADTRGSWQIAALPEGTQTLVRYRAWVDSGQPVPRFVERFLTRRSLPRLMGGLRDEVERRFP